MRAPGIVLLTAIAIGTVGIATKASPATYVYQGNGFTNITDADPPSGSFNGSMAIAGSIEFAEALPANLFFQDVTSSIESFSVSDGRLEINSGNNSDLSVSLATDASGEISSLFFFAQSLDIDAGLSQRHEIVTRSGGGSDFDRSLIIVDDGGIEVGRDIAISDPPVGSWSRLAEPVPSIRPLTVYFLVPGLLMGIGSVAIRSRTRGAGSN